LLRNKGTPEVEQYCAAYADAQTASQAPTAMVSAAIPGMRASVDISQPLREPPRSTPARRSTANTVTFNNCTISESGFNISLSGTVSVSGEP